jgi:hypothetical protein
MNYDINVAKKIYIGNIHPRILQFFYEVKVMLQNKLRELTLI